MITATAWVPRGYAAAFPTKYVFDDDEYGRIAKLAKLQLDDAKEDLEEAEAESADHSSGAKRPTKEEKPTRGADEEIEDADDDLKEYDLEHYDDVTSQDEAGEGSAMGMFGNVKSLVYHENSADDPYIVLKGDEDEEDREDLQILPTDNMILAARIEDDVAHLEVYVYEDEADNLYVHHDIMLPAIPLSVEWLDIAVGKNAADPGSKANFVAIGTMDPEIEIWDLDTVDCMYPNAILGKGADDTAADKPKKKKKKSRKPNDNYHVDAVLSLAANRQHRNLLASSSADSTIKLWDLNTTACAKSYSYHTNKVCSVAWHPQESTVLLSGSYDKTVVAADMRAPNAEAPRWIVESDVESVRWNPHEAHHFFVTTEQGFVHYYDARKQPSQGSEAKAIWSLQAHDDAVSSFDVNPVLPGFIVTGSTDKNVKLWDIQPGKPSMIVSRSLDVGRVFSTTFGPDREVGFRLAVAGSKGTMQIWDTSTNAAVRRSLAERIGPVPEHTKERFIGRDEESSESEDEEDGEANGSGNAHEDAMEDD